MAPAKGAIANFDTGFREEVLNVVLAELLDERGIVSAPESIKRGPGRAHRTTPDVFVSSRGLRTVLKGRVDDSPNQGRHVVSGAKMRPEQGITHVSTYAAYNERFRRRDLMRRQLTRNTLRMGFLPSLGPPGK
ncbi:MAG: hypothetical protein QHH76_04970 [Bacillota bacterium]|nr:hypothetical protein [Bacillota bacterium]